jgi:hypothetical protein
MHGQVLAVMNLRSGHLSPQQKLDELGDALAQ